MTTSNHSIKPTSNLGRFLLDKMTRENWSIQDVVAASSRRNPGGAISEAALRKLLTGNVHHPSPVMRTKLCAVFGIDLPELIRGEKLGPPHTKLFLVPPRS